MPSRRLLALLAAAIAATVVLAGRPAPAQAPRSGGVLNAMLGEDPPGLSIHEAGTISALWPVLPCYSNLVLFDPLKPHETAESVIPELAQRWSWQDNYRNLVFFLRRNVRWHDGRPFTSADVKYTFDVVREARDAPGRLRLSPRKDWFVNVDTIETPDPHTVIFRLRRPQPALLLMLASGYSPIYPAHVPLAELRLRCVGTGPFRFRQWSRGQVVELERNPDYFVPGRPYLDGIRYPVIVERSTRMAALQAGRLDVAIPLDMTKVTAESVRKAAPALVTVETGQIGSDNVIMNLKRAPFDNPVVRRAVDYALDRQAHVQAVRHGGATIGAALMPPPFGAWGLSARELRSLPGYRGSAQDKREARRLLASAGHGPGKPLRLELSGRAYAIYQDFTAFVTDQLHQVGIEVTLRELDTSAWFPALARRDFQIAANATAAAIDDPDVYLYENYKCGTSRNYTDYCSEEVDRLIDQQSQELDRAKRQKLVWEIQRKLAADVAKPMLGWRNEYFTYWPYVRNLVPHHSLYNWGRMQDVWLDRPAAPAR